MTTYWKSRRRALRVLLSVAVLILLLGTWACTLGLHDRNAYRVLMRVDPYAEIAIWAAPPVILLGGLWMRRANRAGRRGFAVIAERHRRLAPHRPQDAVAGNAVDVRQAGNAEDRRG